MSRENKDKRFEIRLSESERDRFFTAAEACGMTPSQYMRTMLWFLHPAKLPTEKYVDMLEQLLEVNKNLKALTAEIKLSGEIPSKEITLITQKIDALGDEVLFAIQHPFEAIDPEDVRHLPYEFLFGEGWRKLRERNLAQSNRNTEK